MKADNIAFFPFKRGLFLEGSFAQESSLLHKRLSLLGSLLILATPYSANTLISPTVTLMCTYIYIYIH